MGNDGLTIKSLLELISKYIVQITRVEEKYVRSKATKKDLRNVNCSR